MKATSHREVRWEHLYRNHEDSVSRSFRFPGNGFLRRAALLLVATALCLVGCGSPPSPDLPSPAPFPATSPPVHLEIEVLFPSINDVLYVESLVGIWGNVYRIGSGVLVHDCPVHGTYVATCWHVVDELIAYSAVVGGERWPIEVAAHDETADVALLALRGVDPARACRPVPRVNGGVPRVVDGTLAVWRDDVATLHHDVLPWMLPAWWWGPDEIRYGDSGAPLYDDGWVLGLVRRLSLVDPRRFEVVPCGMVLALLRETVGICE